MSKREREIRAALKLIADAKDVIARATAFIFQEMNAEKRTAPKGTVKKTVRKKLLLQ